MNDSVDLKDVIRYRTGIDPVNDSGGHKDVIRYRTGIDPGAGVDEPVQRPQEAVLRDRLHPTTGASPR